MLHLTKMSPKKILLITIIVLVLLISYFTLSKKTDDNSKINQQLTHNKSMQLQSSAFQEKNLIPSKYTCDGEDIIPPLSFHDIPDETKTLAIIMDDPDAPGGNWDHWLVWNIPADVQEIEENKLPNQAVQGENSWSQNNWGGPCPPSGTHRYQFKLFALDIELDIKSSSNKQALLEAMKNHILDQTMLTGLYQRQ